MKKSGERGAYGVADEKEFIIITKAKDLAFHTYDMTTARAAFQSGTGNLP